MDSKQPDCRLNDPANRNRIVPTIRLCLWCALLPFLLIFIFPVRVFSQNTAESPSTGGAKEAPVTADRLLMGKQLSLIYCQTCHIYPHPELLDKKTWQNGVLPRMRIQLGLDPASINRNPEAAQLWATGKFSRFPLIADEQYKQISEYYLEAAPTNPLPQEPKGDLQLGLRQFKLHNPSFRVSPAMTTCLEISNSGRYIYLGDAQTRSLYILDARGNLLRTINVDNIPVSIHEGNQGLYLTCIGRFYPSEIPLGSLLFLKKGSAQEIFQKVLFSELPRPTHSAFADFNGDGHQDVLMSMFGNFSGKFSLFQGLDNGDFQEKVLMDLPGAVRSEIHDFNGDGHPDIAVLMAQHYETFNLLINDGKGSFKTHEILRQHPVFGSSYFEMKDFNLESIGRDAGYDIGTGE
ncbi:MAG TPA: VCBS repeat-containing protein [Verrucomicrobiales bacterium]|nr:VCBS repeat-containing protein [Verrucomicrobiales bacterium]